MQFALGGYSEDALASVRFTNLIKPKIAASNFATIAVLIHGTKMVTTQAEQMHLAYLTTLDMADLPFETDNVSVSMVWHELSSSAPSHKWLRSRVMDQVRRIGLK